MEPAIKRVGRSEGLPLVLLHGFGGTMGTWDKVVPMLSGEMPVVLVDLPGHGGSVDSDGRGGAGRMAKAILAALAAEGIDTFHLGGHSMGGAVAMLMAMREPRRVKSLALVAPGGMSPEIDGALLGEFSKARTPAELRTFIERMAAPGTEWPDGYFEQLAAAREKPGALAALGETYTAMFPEGPEKGQGTLPRDQLAGLPMPVLMLWGDDDTVLPCPQSGGLPANFTLSVAPGAGHMLPEETPDAVADLLRSAQS